MGLVLILFLLALLLGSVGFAVHFLWIAALIVLGFAVVSWALGARR